ncbi:MULTISPECIES: hypothetical protein [unclassified Shewanella]|uniref:hypothetical protein n=1 Tax=unclassified Shewanella TaxID=196818 RepID=UPI00354D50B8
MTRNIEDLAACGADEGGLYIPGNLCNFVLLNLRLSDLDIKDFESRGGIASLYSIHEDVKYIYLDAFIKAGTSVNNESVMSGLPPLHAAILANDNQLVTFLLAREASLTQLNSQFGMNARDFTYHLAEIKPNVDRSDVLNTLSVPK